MNNETADPVVQSTDRQDAVGGVDTIYSASMGSVVWRNFIAGASRAVGGLFIQTIGIIVFIALLQAFVAPQLAPIMDMFARSTQTLENLSQTLRSQEEALNSAPQASQEQLNRILEQTGGFFRQ